MLKLRSILCPLPLTIEPQRGCFNFPKALTVFSTDDAIKTSQMLGLPLAMAKDTGSAMLSLSKDELPASAYSMKITSSHIAISYGDGDGLWNALETLRQISLSITEDENSVECATVIDRPAISWRGFMLDCCRHFMPAEWIKKMLKAASLLHLNRFHWHLTDDQGWRIPIPGLEALTEIGARRSAQTSPDDLIYGQAYTLDEINDVLKLAEQLHITVIPEIELPGHASAILAAYPELGCTKGPYNVEVRWGIFPDLLCAGNDKVFEVLKTIFTAVASIFPGPYIHIGGDECPKIRWHECPACQARMKAQDLKDEEELQAWFTSKVCRIVSDLGKTPIGWDEILEGSERFGLPKDAIIMSWRGIEGAQNAIKAGHQAIMCPTTGGFYLDYRHQDSPQEPGAFWGVSTVKQVYTFPSWKDQDIIGAQGNLWTEQILSPRWAEYMIFPRLVAIAESLWLGEAKDYESFLCRKDMIIARLIKLGILTYQGSFE